MIKVSDYIAEFFVKKGIETVFTVVGGGAMHLNDSFGHCEGINCIYNHHEQACSMAAEAYYRVSNRIAGVCVTSGPGAINALNGVVGAFQDSIPMIVISGQVKSTLTIKSSGLNLRTFGGQEFDIVSCLNNCVKYSETVYDKNKILYCLEKAHSLALSGRPGPCWLDIPIDIQGSYIDEKDLYHYEYEDNKYDDTDDLVKTVLDRLKQSRRPVLYAGNGIRLGSAIEEMRAFIYNTGIQVVTCWDSIDLIETDNPYYAGRAGLMGNRAGNFAVQNSDFLLCVGNRLSIYQVGYNPKTWARKAYVIDVDIDSEELKKNTIHVDLPIQTDAKLFFEKINKLHFENKGNFDDWKYTCNTWKVKYPVVSEKHYSEQNKTNVYAFIDRLSSSLTEGYVSVVGNGSASVVGSASFNIKKDSRFVMNCAISSMGYDLPASIGACVANKGNSIVCITGDGSIQMNIQELQTIVTNKLPIKIFIINNEGYHQIRLTQRNIFNNGLVGVGKESGDLDFPDFKKIAWAYGYPYYSINNKGKRFLYLRSVLFYNTNI